MLKNIKNLVNMKTKLFIILFQLLASSSLQTKQPHLAVLAKPGKRLLNSDGCRWILRFCVV